MDPPTLEQGELPGEVLVSCVCGQQMRAPASVMGNVGRCTLCGRTFVSTSENTVPAPPRDPYAEREKSAPAPQPPTRIESLDQLRGYAIFGMIVVNFLGAFSVMPWVFEHQRDTFSYADTIAPLFVFVVGMGFRLSILRRARKSGLAEARRHAFKRYLVLLLVALVFYGPDYMKDWWDALTEIALAGLLTLPFIDKKASVRVVAAFGFLAAFMFCFLFLGYASWLAEYSMNGGPLGSLGAAFVLLFGTLAYDLLASDDTQATVRWSLIAGCGLVALAFLTWWLMPKDLPGYEPYGPHWPFAKRWGAAPFVCLATGIAFLTFLFFYYTCDLAGVQFPHLTILGENPLVIYLVQYALLEMNGVYLPERYLAMTGVGGLTVALVGFTLFYGFVYAVARRLHRDNILVKL